jgi:large subunit ribosomal protein L30
MKVLEIRQVRSAIGRPENQRRVLKSLGLGKLHRAVEHDATPQILGMLAKVSHLVAWTERQD